ncbi:metallophosphoesterase [Blastococcus sp. CT_GayMR16]|uniref:metallophosphoesterase family protein n=1 Tax=Blastococcus sp. CT_GayMR16 TaxID=2559607 RepID=UPI001073221C|nr:metallophosphoesterase [Blastococcus sp. CT_GayMR16]TFV91072.1 hypothetical protein E4P38_00150 [Blastococcus sp. CT_GayMR16]
MSRWRWAALVCSVVVAGLVAYLMVSPPAFLSSVITGDVASPVAGEAVPPIEGKPVIRVAITGDTGTGSGAEQATAERMDIEGESRPYDALLLLGDLVYEEGDAALVDRVVTQPFAPLVEGGAQLLPVLGNHDYRSGEQEAILDALGRDNPWYVERVGSVRVVVLDSNRLRDAAQTRWLRATLVEPQPPGSWTIVGMHHPAYSAGHHGSDMEVRRTWGPLFAAAQVPLVLAGHDHDYERTTPQDGVTYVVSGAGAKTRTVGHEDFTAVSSSTLHFLDLLVYDDRIEGRAIDQSGQLVDSFRISR